MKRSTQVAAPLLAASALALLAACRRQPEMQRCVDEHNHVVDPTFCRNQPAASGFGNPGFIPMYRYYYGGGGGFAVGSPVMGGGYAPLAGHAYSAPTGTTRGGFGSSHAGSGGEGGEAGGGGGE